MANYFSTRNELNSKIDDAFWALRALYNAKDEAHQNYLSELTNLIKSRPGLTATQYAMLMSNDASERDSIQRSISNMGYMAQAHEKKWINYKNEPERMICNNPSMPSLKRKQTLVKRRFIEVDENDKPIGTCETTEYCITYSIKED